MSSSKRPSRMTLNSARSHLGKTLLQLHKQLEDDKENDARQERHLKEWQKKWNNRRDQISQKLKTLELQLDQLQQGVKPPVRLAVVNPHAETEEQHHGIT